MGWLYSAIEGVTLILETEVEEAPTDDYGVAKLIQEKIIKVNKRSVWWKAIA